MHHLLTKEKNLSRQPDNRRPAGQPATGPVNKRAVVNTQAVVSRCAVVNGRAVTMGEGGDRSDSSAQCMYTYTAPQKNSVLKGLLPTSTNTRTVYHKMSVYDFSFMIPFILYSLKELRLGLNCLMKLLPYGTQSITRNLGLYTYTKYFLLCISTANSRMSIE